MHWLIRPWRHMLDFNGRATRREYWLFQLQVIVLWFVAAMLFGLLSPAYRALAAGPGTLVLLIFMCVFVVANLAVAVRRLHDHDKSGWFYLLAFVPLIGWIFVLFMMLTPGTEGENSYGYDPRYGDEAPVEEVGAVFS